jgi:flavin reductase (DIM6/NTAB) family NADH-FMN oxidoreductase RutF
MDSAAKKTSLRMIPYGLYVLTADAGGGEIAAATVNWVTQTAFEPPLVAVAVKADSQAYAQLKKAGAFALNVLGKEHKGVAFTFFKPAAVEGDRISGQPFVKGTTGAPLLTETPASLECRVRSIVAEGDHHVVVAEVVEAHLRSQPAGRADAVTLEMKDLGDNVYYGG